jgi:hypothetical protein
MATRAIDAEMEKLSGEVARLRVMVERVVDHKSRSVSEASAQPHPPAGHSIIPTPQFHRDPFTVPVPLPTSPVAVLPTIFAGQDGTARLFRLLLDTYPWLEPPEVTEARDIVAREKDRQSQLFEKLEAEAAELRSKHHALEQAAQQAQLAVQQLLPRSSSPSPTAIDQKQTVAAKAAPPTPRSSTPRIFPAATESTPLNLNRMGVLPAKRRQANLVRKMQAQSDDEDEDENPARRATPLLERKSSLIRPPPISQLDTEF